MARPCNYNCGCYYSDFLYSCATNDWKVSNRNGNIETSTTPIFQAEVCTATHRLKLVSVELMFVAGGILMNAYWFCYGMSFAKVACRHANFACYNRLCFIICLSPG